MDNTTLIQDPVLLDLKAALTTAYGTRLEQILLFGSRARGDARDDSDYDVAVFLRDLSDYWRESRRLSDIGYDIMIERGGVVNAIPLAAGSLQERTPIMFEIRKDGVEL